MIHVVILSNAMELSCDAPEPAGLYDLPADMLYEIFRYFPLLILAKIREVSALFNQVVLTRVFLKIAYIPDEDMDYLPPAHYDKFRALQHYSAPHVHEVCAGDVTKLMSLTSLHLGRDGFHHNDFNGCCTGLGQLAHLQVLSVHHYATNWIAIPPLQHVHTLKLDNSFQCETPIRVNLKRALPNVTILYTKGHYTHYELLLADWPDLKELHVHRNESVSIDLSVLRGHALEVVVATGHPEAVGPVVGGAELHPRLRDLRMATPRRDFLLDHLPALEHVAVWRSGEISMLAIRQWCHLTSLSMEYSLNVHGGDLPPQEFARALPLTLRALCLGKSWPLVMQFMSPAQLGGLTHLVCANAHSWLGVGDILHRILSDATHLVALSVGSANLMDCDVVLPPTLRHIHIDYIDAGIAPLVAALRHLVILDVCGHTADFAMLGVTEMHALRHIIVDCITVEHVERLRALPSLQQVSICGTRMTRWASEISNATYDFVAVTIVSLGTGLGRIYARPTDPVSTDSLLTHAEVETATPNHPPVRIVCM